MHPSHPYLTRREPSSNYPGTGSCPGYLEPVRRLQENIGNQHLNLVIFNLVAQYSYTKTGWNFGMRGLLEEPLLQRARVWSLGIELCESDGNIGMITVQSSGGHNCIPSHRARCRGSRGHVRDGRSVGFDVGGIRRERLGRMSL